MALKPGEQIGTQMGDGVGVLQIQDIETLADQNKTVNGKSFRDALQEIENYTQATFRVPTRAAIMKRKMFNLSGKSRFLGQMDKRAWEQKKLIDKQLRKASV